MRKVMFFILAMMFIVSGFAQKKISDSLMYVKDSVMSTRAKGLIEKIDGLRAEYTKDSIKMEKEFAEKAKWEALESKFVFPALKGSKSSGVIPVVNPTEIPDPEMEFKILFELTGANPDSTAKDINAGLDEIARVINLHVASGIPLKKIMPVIVVHGSALQALKSNTAYQKKYKLDNPNIKLINSMMKMGARFIACGQAMEYFDVKREDFIPDIKVSLTAQTALTNYQLKGYVWHPVW